MPESTDAKEIWKWLRKADLKIQTESLVRSTRTGPPNKICQTLY